MLNLSLLTLRPTQGVTLSVHIAQAITDRRIATNIKLSLLVEIVLLHLDYVSIA